MAIFHEKEGDSGTFAGGVMSQALAKHHHGKKDKKSEISEHLKAAEEHLHAAKEAHEGSGMSEEPDMTGESGISGMFGGSESSEA